MKKYLLICFLIGSQTTTCFGQFTAQNHGSNEASFVDIDCFNSRCFAIGNANGVIITSVDGVNWTNAKGNLPDSLRFQKIVFLDQSSCIVSDEYGSLHKTTNNGSSWQNLSNRSTFNTHFIDNQTGFAINSNQYFFKTINGGTSWDTLNTPSPVGQPFFHSNELGFSLYSDSIYRTSDGGQSWDLVSTDPTNTYALLDLKMVNSNVGYAVGTRGTILKTSNGGQSWTKSPSPSSDNVVFNSVDFFDENNGCVVGSSSHILNTNDGGITWTDESFNYKIYLRSVKFLNGTSSLAVGMNYLMKN